MSTMRRPMLLIAPGLAVVLAAWLHPSNARAQTEPPPAAAESPAVVTATAPVATPPGATPPGDAPSPAAAPPSPSAAPLPPPALAPAPSPSAMADPGALPLLPPPDEQPPVYKQPWFWAVAGVAVLTAVMITIGLSTQGPSTPSSDLGNMRAY